MAKESLKKITATAKKTAEYLRQTAELVSQVRAIAVEIDPEAADAPAADLPTIIAAGLRERLEAAEQAAAAATEAVGGKADKSEALAAVNLGITRTPSSVAFAPTGLRVDASVRAPSPTVLSAATLTAAGVMSAADKAALDSAGESIKMMFGLLQAKMTAQEIIGVIGPERYRELRPDVVAVVEPADGILLANFLSADTVVEVQAVDGVITEEQLPDGILGNGLVCPYEVEAIHYWDISKVALKSPCKANIVNRAKKPAPTSRLALIEGLVGWGENEAIDRSVLCWWIEPWSGGHYLADHVSLRGKWGSKYVKQINFMLNMSDRAVVFDEMPSELILGPHINDMNDTEWAFNNIKTTAFPTIDFSVIKPISNCRLTNFCNLQGDDLDDWMPEKPQKALFKGMGGNMYRTTLVGIKDWDYDDMIASLLTYSVDRVAAKLPCNYSSFQLYKTSYDKLTDEDKAAIVAKGYTLTSHTNGVS